MYVDMFKNSSKLINLKGKSVMNIFIIGRCGFGVNRSTEPPTPLQLRQGHDYMGVRGRVSLQ